MEDSETATFNALIISSLVIYAILRILLKRYKCFVPEDLIMTVISLAFGIATALTEGNKYEKTMNSITKYILMALFPSYTITALLRMDPKKCLAQISKISLMAFIGIPFNMTVLMFVMRYVCNPNWNFHIAFITTLIVIPTHTTSIIDLFKSLPNNKSLNVLLDNEFILSSTICISIFYEFEVHDDTKSSYWKILWHFLIKGLFGIILGYVMGKIASILVYSKQDNPPNCTIIFLCMTYLTYNIAVLININMCIATFIMVFLVLLKEEKLSMESSKFFKLFWETLHSFFDLVGSHIIIRNCSQYLLKSFKFQDLYLPIFVYVAVSFVRMLSFIIIGFISYKTTIKFNVASLVVLSWAGLKGGVNLILASSFIAHPKYFKMGEAFYKSVFFLVLWNIVINQTLLKLILNNSGLTNISSVAKERIQSCLELLMKKRWIVITYLKSNPTLRDANWHIVRQYTLLRDPSIEKNSIAKRIGYFYDKPIICTDCLKEIPIDFDMKDITVKMKEAHIQILRRKTMVCIEQFEKGEICRPVLCTLINIFENMMESQQKHKRLDIFSFELKILYRLHLLMKYLFRDRHPSPPKHVTKLLIYYITMHLAYDYFFLVFILTYTTTFVVLPMSDIVNSIHSGLICLFVVDILLKSLRNDNPCLKHFFKYFWNNFDLLVLLFDGVIILLYYIEFRPWHLPYWLVVRYLKIFYYLHPLIKKITNYLEKLMDYQIIFGYELALALLTSCIEVEENLESIIIIPAVLTFYKNQLALERQLLTKEIHAIHKEKPWVVFTVRTKQAIQTTLYVMESFLNHLNSIGELQLPEYCYISQMIQEKRKRVLKMNIVPTNSYSSIFFNVPWMSNIPEVAKYLLDNATVISLKPQQIIYNNGTHPRGIYIALRGVFKITYISNKNIWNAIITGGHIPVIDQVHSRDFGKSYRDTFMSGNTFGELGFLTNRRHDCSVAAVTSCEAFFITNSVIQEAINVDSNPVTGLEAKMWKCAILNLASTIMLDSPVYQSLTSDQIKLKLETAFVPNLSCYSVFVITEMMDDVILINGIVSDKNTGEIFIAPVLLPRTTQQLNLHSESYLTLSKQCFVKLLITPAGDLTKEEIMKHEEKVAVFTDIVDRRYLLTSDRQTYDTIKLSKIKEQSKESTGAFRNNRQSYNIDMQRGRESLPGWKIVATDEAFGRLQYDISSGSSDD